MKRSITSISFFALIFPFWTMIASVRYFKSDYAKNLFWYGCAFMGLLHIFNPVGGSGSDGVRYAAALVNMYNNPLDFNTIIGYLYAEGGKLDVYQVVLTFVISLFTNNPHILFLAFAIVFGYFFSQNIWLLLNRAENENLKWWIWVIVAAFIFVNPVWNINGVRMYTALQVFIYGVFSFYLSDNKFKICWVFLSVFFHFSFLIPACLFVIYLILPKKNITVFFILYFACSIFNEIDIESLKDKVVGVVPEVFSDKANTYMNEDYAISAKEGKNNFALYIHIAEKLSKAFIYSILIFFWLNVKSLFKNELHRNFLIMFLFFGSIIELLSSIPSMSRFYMLQNMIFYALLLLILFDNKDINSKLHKFTSYFVLLIFLPVLFDIRKGFEFYGLSLLWGNFVSAFALNDNLPLIDIVKSIL